MDDEEDPFSGIEDLKDNNAAPAFGASSATGGAAQTEEPTFVGEEFDVGPSFIRRQREEENIWRKRTEGWVSSIRENGEHRGGWRWEIRNLAAGASAAEQNARW